MLVPLATVHANRSFYVLHARLASQRMITMHRRRTSPHVLAGLLLCMGLAIGCASRTYAPVPPQETGLFERIETQQAGDLTVSAAVPGVEETKSIFGLPLYKRGIQPIWIEVVNNGAEGVRFAPVGTDATYFPAHEVAYIHKGKYKGDAYRQMESQLHEQSMPRWIWPGETRSGWVFTHEDPGTKAFNVDLFDGSDYAIGFSFFIDVPDRIPDHADIDFETLYADDEIAKLDIEGFRAALLELSCCTTDKTGEKPGLPTNVALVGTGYDVLKALLRADFFERSRADRPSVVDVEPHFDGRPADAVFRTGRSGLGDRNELRLWRAPMQVDGAPVWMGQITHYIGPHTEIGRALFDDRLDPNIDDARDFILQIMWYSQSLLQFAWQDSAPPSSVSDPATDFRNVPYFSSGERVVLWLSGVPVSQNESERLDWDVPGEEKR
jgi:hypothetical protein